MKILITLVICNCVLGAALSLYLVIIWRKYKEAVAAHGWNPECADPLCRNMWLLCFIPIFGMLYYLVVGETIGILSTSYKDSVDGIVTVSYGSLSFHYSEE